MATPVSKTQVLLWLGCSIVLIASGGWALLQDHGNRPHEGSITNARFVQYTLREREWRDEQRQQMKTMQGYLQEMQRQQVEANNETHNLLLTLLKGVNDLDKKRRD